MLQTFLIISQQVAVLFLLMLIGWLLGRHRRFTEETVRGLDFLILNLALPCTILRAFQLEHSAAMLRNFLVCTVVSLAIQGLFFLVALLSARHLPRDEQGVYVLSASLTNCSFMGFPLQSALLGEIGILYSSGFVLTMNVLTFSAGYYLLTRDRRSVSPGQLLTRPAILGTAAGLLLFLLELPLPTVAATLVGHLADLTVPIPMFIIGYHLSQTDLRAMLHRPLNWLFSALRLLVLPLLALGLLSLLPLEREVFLSLAVCASCPAATVVTILASRFTAKGELSAELGAMQTLLSLLTMPAMLAFATWLC